METNTYLPTKINIISKPKTIQPLLGIPDKIDVASAVGDIVQVATNPTGAVVDLAKSVIGDAATKAVDVFKGFRIESLPRHEDDFANAWFYNATSSLVPENVTIEYNAYMQVMSELRDSTLKLLDGFDGATICHDLETYIMEDFRKANLKYDPTDNLIHRAWFAHCTKRAIDSLRQGQFRGEDGYVNQYPQIADIIDRRVNEIIMKNTLFMPTVQ